MQTSNVVVGKDFDMSIEEAAKQNYSENGVTSANKSSIAFLFEYGNKKLLFLGDAVSSQISSELRKMGYSEEFPLGVDACKIMHYGSKHNTSKELIKVIDCKKYLISGKRGTQRPSKVCFSSIVLNSKGPVSFFAITQSKRCLLLMKCKDTK